MSCLFPQAQLDLLDLAFEPLTFRTVACWDDESSSTESSSSECRASYPAAIECVIFDHDPIWWMRACKKYANDFDHLKSSAYSSDHFTSIKYQVSHLQRLLWSDNPGSFATLNTWCAGMQWTRRQEKNALQSLCKDVAILGSGGITSAEKLTSRDCLDDNIAQEAAQVAQMLTVLGFHVVLLTSHHSEPIARYIILMQSQFFSWALQRKLLLSVWTVVLQQHLVFKIISRSQPVRPGYWNRPKCVVIMIGWWAELQSGCPCWCVWRRLNVLGCQNEPRKLRQY